MDDDAGRGRATSATTEGAVYPLLGASVLLTGASGGIGAALAAELHRRGATLTMVARRDGPLRLMETPGARLALDLRDAESCERAVAAALDHAGRLDVVVNAVGVVAFGAVADLSVDVMEELFLTNTFVPIMLARAALGAIGDDGGAIVNISGVIAERNLPGMAAYGASKAAVRSFGDALAREARAAKVRVIDARPPHTETGLAGRPLAGAAPRMSAGLDPAMVATVICDGLEWGAADLPAQAFSPPGR